MEILLSKPVLIGVHLGLAILGIDAMLWLAGEYAALAMSTGRKVFAAVLGVIGFVGSWIIGGYYYVKFYGPLVKPTIVEGLTPWAHKVAMEAKEHIFLLIVPIVITILLATRATESSIRKPAMWLAILVAVMGLSIGAMGYIISAAARWGVVSAVVGT
ncbi:MAG: hypothetical protein AAB590_00640 [Patescibacteria group bacterium]